MTTFTCNVFTVIGITYAVSLLFRVIDFIEGRT